MEPITKKGTLYGVSVGPGDPELLTLQAVKCITQCPLIAAPQTAGGHMLALEIVRQAVDLSEKTIVPLRFAMSCDTALQHAAHEKVVNTLRPYLDAGQDVDILNLGDVSIYATFGYIQAILQPLGYPTVMLAGVPSFCAAAARLNVPLTGGMDAPLTIAPAHAVPQVLDAPGAKVLMKSGRELPAVLAALEERGLLGKSALVCNCGLPDERIYPDLVADAPGEEAGYLATILVKG